MTEEEKRPDDKLILYFMGQTNERLTQIEARLVELIAFRAEVMASARSSAMWISLLASIVSLGLGIILRKVGL